MLFRKPPVVRRLETLWLIGLTVQIVIGLLVGVVLTGKPVLFGVSAFGAGFILFVLRHVVSPDNHRLDGGRRTYEWTMGWPWKPVRVTCFVDIKGVCVSPNHNVTILMAKPGLMSRGVIVSSPYISSAGSTALLIDSSHIAASRALAEELNRVYGFAIVRHPKKHKGHALKRTANQRRRCKTPLRGVKRLIRIVQSEFREAVLLSDFAG